MSWFSKALRLTGPIGGSVADAIDNPKQTKQAKDVVRTANDALRDANAQVQANSTGSNENIRDVNNQTALINRDVGNQALNDYTGVMQGGLQDQLRALMQSYNSQGDILNNGKQASRADLQEGYGRTLNFLNPYLQTGENANTQLNALQNGDMSHFYTDPSYQFAKQQGEDALARNAAAKGTFFSGADSKALDTFNQGLATQQYQNYLQQLNQNANRGVQTSEDAAKAAQTLGQALNTNDNNYAAAFGQLEGNRGTANQNYLGGKAQLTGGQIMGTAQNNMGYNQQYGQNYNDFWNNKANIDNNFATTQGTLTAQRNNQLGALTQQGMNNQNAAFNSMGEDAGKIAAAILSGGASMATPGMNPFQRGGSGMTPYLSGTTGGQTTGVYNPGTQGSNNGSNWGGQIGNRISSWFQSPAPSTNYASSLYTAMPNNSGGYSQFGRPQFNN
jgi:hypothetical protein